MPRALAISITLTVALLWAGYSVGALAARKAADVEFGQLVVAAWSESRFRAGPYGAYVHFEPAGHYNKLVLNIYSHEKSLRLRYSWVMGSVLSHEQAVARFGTIEWREDGLHIGTKASLKGNSGPEHAYVPIWLLEPKEPTPSTQSTTELHVFGR